MRLRIPSECSLCPVDLSVVHCLSFQVKQKLQEAVEWPLQVTFHALVLPGSFYFSFLSLLMLMLVVMLPPVRCVVVELKSESRSIYPIGNFSSKRNSSLRPTCTYFLVMLCGVCCGVMDYSGL